MLDVEITTVIIVGQVSIATGSQVKYLIGSGNLRSSTAHPFLYSVKRTGRSDFK